MVDRRTHLVWDWNGTLLNDIDLAVACTNAAVASVGGGPVSVDQHRVKFRRPVADYYAEVLGRAVDADEFGRLDTIFHDAYRAGLTTCELATDARSAIGSWAGTQSLLSMWFHDELVPATEAYGLGGLFGMIDGRRTGRTGRGGDRKATHLVRHLDRLRVDARSTVLIGDSLDDADAADAVGAACVLYTGGFTDPRRLRASGLPVADSLTEAVRIAATIA
jgi:phosphoglycolate phosphatase-like HAD superfamily hydrolase